MNLRQHAVVAVMTMSGILGAIRSEAIADEKSPTFEIIATLKNSEKGNGLALLSQDEPFRSAVIRFPWVYVLTRPHPAKLFIFRLQGGTANSIGGENQHPITGLNSIRVIDNIGDGYNLMRWDSFLVCTRRGSLEVYSLENPEKPRRVSQCEPSSGKGYETLGIVRSGNRAFVIGDRILFARNRSPESSLASNFGQRRLRGLGVH